MKRLALVVIGIISVLAAITLPIISHTRERGRRAACQSNLQQLAAAVQQYIPDYDGVYPMERFAYKVDGAST
ncbi:MAG: DUF1559 domain-containing protein, partial [Cytophagales bacterium]|nr:DUF1559 domain-containing protein [Armatimonadota bacterium]